MLDSPEGRMVGSKSLKTIAGNAGVDEVGYVAVRTRLLSDLPGQRQVQSWDIYACVRQVLDVLDRYRIRCRTALCPTEPGQRGHRAAGHPPLPRTGRTGVRARLTF